MEEPVYQCPGEVDQISPAVHRARLEAGWPGCRDCVWNDHPAIQLTDHGPAPSPHRGLRRTSFGVRGPYLNVMDRRTAAMMASVFAAQLSESEFDRQLLREESATTVTVASQAKIVVGYDLDPNSPDLFAGVVQAVCRTGCGVIEIGCCTAASLQHSMRELRSTGGILVTTAESNAGEIGLDVFDALGQAVSVPWQKFGIRHRLKKQVGDAEQRPFESAASQFAESLRQRDQGSKRDRASASADFECGQLILPDDQNLFDACRGRQRQSGPLRTQSTEADYRNSLLRWWPSSATLAIRGAEPIRVFSRNTFVTDRIAWLAEETQTSLEIHDHDLPPDIDLQKKSRRPLTVLIEDDDRALKIWSKNGRRIGAIELVEWLNGRLSRLLRHVTAHAGPGENLIQLLDVAGPESADAYSRTTDALAVLGLLLQLDADGKHPLPL